MQVGSAGPGVLRIVQPLLCPHTLKVGAVGLGVEGERKKVLEGLLSGLQDHGALDGGRGDRHVVILILQQVEVKSGLASYNHSAGDVKFHVIRVPCFRQARITFQLQYFGCLNFHDPGSRNMLQCECQDRGGVKESAVVAATACWGRARLV
jgi:hypothetical protein